MAHAIGRIVRYTLTEQDAEAINRRRADTQRNLADHRARADGSQVHVGNTARAGDVFPMLITRVWDDSNSAPGSVNGQVFLDGNDTLWVTSVSEGPGERHFEYPTIAKATPAG